MVFESLAQFTSKLMMFHGYVNEYNGYPKPLTKEEEENYVKLMENGDKSAREILINHNMRLVAHIAKKYSGSAEADDLISVGSIGLIKAVDSYKLSKGSQLSTYASRCIENEMLMLLRSNKKHKVCVSIDEVICNDSDGADLTLRDIIPQKQEDEPGHIVEVKVLMQDVKKEMARLLDEREYKVISLRYGLDDGVEHTQQEIAKMLDISRSYVSRIERKAFDLIQAEFKNGMEYDRIHNE